jgi:hypothetical protein
MNKVCFVEVKQEFEESEGENGNSLDEFAGGFNDCCCLCAEGKELRKKLLLHLDENHCKFR